MPNLPKDSLPKDDGLEGLDIALGNSLSQNVTIDQIPQLKIAQKFSSIFSLLKELGRSNLNGFILKIAVLLLFAQNTQKTTWSSSELNQDLQWMQDSVRKNIIKSLVQSNWLVFDNVKYQLNILGRSLLTMMTALVEQETTLEEPPQDSLGATVSSLALAEMTQTNPANTMRMFINELMRIDSEIENTLESKSEYHIRKLNRRIHSQFNVAIRSRQHLENLPSKDYQTYRLKQEVHERLSSFHARLSQVQRTQNDMVARKIILADQSLTQHDINEFLIASSIEELTNLGKKAIGQPITVPDIAPVRMIHEAEWYLEKDRTKQDRIGWGNLELANESEENVVQYSRFLQFTGEIHQILAQHTQFNIEEITPRQDWATSGFRFCMLSVLESGEVPSNLVENVQVSCPKLHIEQPKGMETAIIKDEPTEVLEISRGIASQAKIESKHNG